MTAGRAQQEHDRNWNQCSKEQSVPKTILTPNQKTQIIKIYIYIYLICNLKLSKDDPVMFYGVIVNSWDLTFPMFQPIQLLLFTFKFSLIWLTETCSRGLWVLIAWISFQGLLGFCFLWQHLPGPSKNLQI